MQIFISGGGVTFQMQDEACPANAAVQQTLKVAKLCGFSPRGLKQLGGTWMLARIGRVADAEWKREMFASRLVFELAERGVIAEVVR